MSVVSASIENLVKPSIVKKMSPGDRIVMLRPVKPEITVPCTGTIRMVMPSGDTYHYLVQFDDNQRALCPAEHAYPANWIGLAKLMAAPGALKDDWQDDLHNTCSTESDLPFERWLELKFDLANHILESLAALGAFQGALPPPLQSAVELYFQVDSDCNRSIEFAEEPEKELEYAI